MQLIIDRIKNHASKEYAEFSRRGLKIKSGYAAEDIVIGCSVKNLRIIARDIQKKINFDELIKLLQSRYHEARYLALIIMIYKFQHGDEKIVVENYLNNTKFINNWDLVDLSAYKIIGEYFDEDNIIFEKLSNSDDIWENRIAIVSTYSFIKKDCFNLTLRLCIKFINHEHYLIHKASGWMLREVGKRDKGILLDFLEKYSNKMPRIMLSYATEKLKL